MGKRPTVLFVDDEQSLLDGLRAYFEDEYEVMTAPTPEAGLALFRKNRDLIDAVVVDVWMRRDGRDGIDRQAGVWLVREITGGRAPADARSLVPIVVLTGAGDAEQALRCVSAGAMWYVAKGTRDGDEGWLADLADKIAFCVLLKRSVPGNPEKRVATGRIVALAAVVKANPRSEPVGQAAIIEGVTIDRVLKEKDASEREFHTRLGREATDLSERLPDGALGALAIFRDWASYSTIPMARPDDGALRRRVAPITESAAPVAGGYLLHWRGAGLAVDPGLGLLSAMADAGLTFRNIDEVVLTHYHLDHTDDLLQVLTCLFEVKDAVEKGCPLPPHELRFFASPSCYEVFAGLLAGTSRFDPAQLRSTSAEPLPVLQGNARLLATPAYHYDLRQRQATPQRDTPTVGIRVALTLPDGAPGPTIGITGDTGWRKDVSAAFTEPEPVDLLVLHIGSVYEQDKAPYDGAMDAGSFAPTHLAWNGAKALLTAIDEAHAKRGTAWLAVICEWGEELRERRHQFAKGLQAFVKHGRVVPGIRDLYVALPQCQPVCQHPDCRGTAPHWMRHPDGRICFYCEEHKPTFG